MAYTKTTWVNGETPINADNLNNIENQLETNTNDINALNTNLNNKENNLKAENEYLNSVIEQAFTPVEKEGTSINYDNTINARFKDIKLCGDTTQNGTPTPDTPVEIQNVTGLQNINVCGKNLFDKTRIISGKRLDNKGLPSISDNSYCTTDYFIAIEPNTTYYSTSVINQAKAVCFYDSNQNFIERVMYTQTNTFTTGSTTHYIKISILLSEIDMQQLEKSNQVTTYEEYKGTSYPINLGDIELCKIGDYQDYIHKDNGKWYLNKQIGKVVLNGSERIIPVNNFTRYNVMSIDNVLEGSINNPNAICNCYNSNYSLDNFNIFSSGDAFLSIMDNRFTALADFKNWLSTNNVIVNYVLKTPTNTEITDTTLLEQLEELAGATTYAGETNIVATSDGLTIIPKTTALTK